jgi:transposase
MVRIIEGLAEDWRRLDERIDHLSDERSQRLRGWMLGASGWCVPGIGPIISSAIWRQLAMRSRKAATSPPG